MRRLLTFDCKGEELAASLDDAAGRHGLLIVTGGTQTRIGSHRLFERLAAGLAEAGHPCFRFDRRGVGDSSGEDPGWRGSRDDIVAAIAAFRGQSRIDRLFGFGTMAGEAVKGFGPGASWFDDVPALAAAAKKNLNKNVAVLVKGSRSSRMERVVAALTGMEQGGEH